MKHDIANSQRRFSADRLFSVGLGIVKLTDNASDVYGCTLDFANSIGLVRHHPHADASGVTEISQSTGQSGRSTSGFTNSALALHTDGTAVDKPANWIVMACGKKALRGGVSVVSDTARANRELETQHPELFAALCDPQNFYFGTKPLGVHAPVLEFDGRYVTRVRFRDDDQLEVSDSAKVAINVWYNMIRTRTLEFDLLPGECLVIDNRRWLHGRTNFNGARTIFRCLVD